MFRCHLETKCVQLVYLLTFRNQIENKRSCQKKNDNDKTGEDDKNPCLFLSHMKNANNKGKKDERK